VNYFSKLMKSRIDGGTLNLILSRKVFPQLPWKRLNSYSPFSTSSITRSEMFMPQTEIIFVRQSCCRIDGQPPDWILGTKVSYQLLWKQMNSKMFIAQTEIFFRMQSPCRIDVRTLSWILSRKAFPQLNSLEKVWKTTLLFPHHLFPRGPRLK
jgi:hypothetical protein